MDDTVRPIPPLAVDKEFKMSRKVKVGGTKLPSAQGNHEAVLDSHKSQNYDFMLINSYNKRLNIHPSWITAL